MLQLETWLWRISFAIWFVSAASGFSNSSNLGSRILGSVFDDDVRANHQCSHHALIIMTSNGTQGLCGGTILSTTWVLTAAHCVFGFEEFNVYVGGDSCNPTNNTCITSKLAYVHPGFWPNLFLYDRRQDDIGMIKLPQEIQLGPGTSIARVAVQNATRCDAWVGRRSVICGCGAVTSDDQVIQAGCNTVVAAEEATPEFDAYKSSETLVWARACNISHGGSCVGDSGGSLMVGADSLENPPEVIALVSFGRSECSPDGYIANTCVTAYDEFIKNPETSKCTNYGCSIKDKLADMSKEQASAILSSLKKSWWAKQLLSFKFAQIVRDFNLLLARTGIEGDVMSVIDVDS